MGNCLKVLTKKSEKPASRPDKPKKLTMEEMLKLDISNIEILHEDGNTSCYFSKYDDKINEISPNELMIMYFETVDSRKEEVQILAGEKVSTLRTKAKAALGLDDVHMFLDGRVLEDKCLLNSYKIKQGAVIDVINVYQP
ncbi:unnamed protein product [Blepharisma stoltei]|uniref:Ubiquitin-like domain-containing protein n=1 Tax=Blepharisma stoltei TaxID=1481888 RepID=A0AAU9IZ08_9CILI|nr:unnamed protein product [Blepharisma stoltei]